MFWMTAKIQTVEIVYQEITLIIGVENYQIIKKENTKSNLDKFMELKELLIIKLVQKKVQIVQHHLQEIKLV